MADDQWSGHAPDLVRDNKLLHEEIGRLQSKLDNFQWIEAHEIMPLGGQEVLTCFKGSEVYNTCIFYPDTGFESLETGKDLTGDVTHWMPLPEAPK